MRQRYEYGRAPPWRADQGAKRSWFDESRGEAEWHHRGAFIALVNDAGRENPTLSDMGVSYDLSSRSQELAATPEAEFESEVGESGITISSCGPGLVLLV
jgi:hypothetical protein